MKMRPFGRLLPTDVALARLLSAAPPVDRHERIPVEEAVGRRSSLRVVAPHAVPPFRRASWDGYAVAAAATRGATAARPVRLRLVGEVYAESPTPSTVAPGCAVAIATGGPLPPGTDGVVIFEEVDVADGTLVVSKPVRPGDRVSEAGDDFARGFHLAERDDLLTPPRLGAIAAAGIDSVDVWSRPRVAILPNGNELRRPGARLSPGAIHESNNTSLASLALALGAEVTTHDPVPDDERWIEAVVRRAIRDVDLLLVTGGSSVGEHDYLPAIFPRLGRLLFHGIAVRPGKPTLAVRAGRTLVIGMPGHPTSCLANGLWLVAPVLARMAHAGGVPWADQPVVLTEPYEVPTSSLATVVPLEVRGGRARPTFRSSASLTSLIPANAYVLLPPHRAALRKGDVVTARLLPAPFADVPVASVGRATRRRNAI
ncbi:MAG: molybdopterin molybdotransferase MoeA [Thermoplasmata archaeon]|nr:molybdopterin molybdotransferase MoeA [Thermoplasmata archaeon]